MRLPARNDARVVRVAGNSSTGKTGRARLFNRFMVAIVNALKTATGLPCQPFPAKSACVKIPKGPPAGADDLSMARRNPLKSRRLFNPAASLEFVKNGMERKLIAVLEPRLAFGLPKFVSLAGIVSLITTTAGAIGVYVPDQDAEAMARSDAFIAKADDPAAVFYNPAGLTQLSGWTASGTLYGIQIDSQYRGLGSADSANKIYLLPQAYLGFHPTNRPVAFGIGVYTPFGLGGDYGNTSPLRPVIIEDSLQFSTISGVASWEILPGLSVGAGPVFNFGSLDIEQGLAPVNRGDWAKFDGSGNSPGASRASIGRLTG